MRCTCICIFVWVDIYKSQLESNLIKSPLDKLYCNSWSGARRIPISRLTLFKLITLSEPHRHGKFVEDLEVSYPWSFWWPIQICILYLGPTWISNFQTRLLFFRKCTWIYTLVYVCLMQHHFMIIYMRSNKQSTNCCVVNKIVLYLESCLNVIDTLSWLHYHIFPLTFSPVFESYYINNTYMVIEWIIIYSLHIIFAGREEVVISFFGNIAFRWRQLEHEHIWCAVWRHPSIHAQRT